MSLTSRLKALGYVRETSQHKAEAKLTESTWRRQVGETTQKVTKLIPVTIGNEVLFRREEAEIPKPITRSLYVVESAKNGVEIYNGGNRYTLEEIEEEEAAEARGEPLPEKRTIIVVDS